MQLPEIRRTVFVYICYFLQELLNHTQDNELDAKTLGKFLFIYYYKKNSELIINLLIIYFIATIFGSIFLRDPPRSRGDKNQRSRTQVVQATIDRKKAAFVYHFLINDQSDFILGR